jgi:hypothetical protein
MQFAASVSLRGQRLRILNTGSSRFAAAPLADAEFSRLSG